MPSAIMVGGIFLLIDAAYCDWSDNRAALLMTVMSKSSPTTTACFFAIKGILIFIQAVSSLLFLQLVLPIRSDGVPLQCLCGLIVCG